jgi:hypothetical protein
MAGIVDRSHELQAGIIRGFEVIHPGEPHQRRANESADDLSDTENCDTISPSACQDSGRQETGSCSKTRFLRG